MNPKTKIRSVRVWTILPATLRDRLSSFSAASNITERAVLAEALEQYLDRTADLTLVLRKLERLGRDAERVHREVEMLSAAFSVFVRIWFAHLPPMAEQEKAAARSEAEDRYRDFVDYVVEEFNGGRRFLDDLPRESVADDRALERIAPVQTQIPNSEFNLRPRG